MEAFVVSRAGNKILVTLDARHFQEDAIARLLNRLYLEQLAEKVDFDEGIEGLGDEIKQDWWEQNKERILAKIHEEAGNS